MEENGEQTASFGAEWPSNSEDIDAIAKALLEASLGDGAVHAGRKAAIGSDHSMF